MQTTTDLTPAERAIAEAEHEMTHLCRLLAGSLSARQRRLAREALVRAARRKVRAEIEMGREHSEAVL